MIQRLLYLCSLVAGIHLLTACPARGQGPTIPGETPLGSRSSRAPFGDTPGALHGASGMSPDDQDEALGGRAGPSVPRVPRSITRPGQGPDVVPLQDALRPPPNLPLTEVPVYGALSIPEGERDEGPPDGLTLDVAIDRLVQDRKSTRLNSSH